MRWYPFPTPDSSGPNLVRIPRVIATPMPSQPIINPSIVVSPGQLRKRGAVSFPSDLVKFLPKHPWSDQLTSQVQ